MEELSSLRNHAGVSRVLLLCPDPLQIPSRGRYQALATFLLRLVLE